MKTEQKKEAVRLRIEERLGISAIKERTGLAQGTLSVLLRDYPLTEQEIRERNVERLKRVRQASKTRQEARRPKPNHLAAKLSPQQKARVSEAAAVFHLLLRGAEIYSSLFDGSKYDLLVNHNDNILKIEVRLTTYIHPKYGRLAIKLHKSKGRHQTQTMDLKGLDFLIGYDIYDDCCYVYSINEITKKRAMVVSDDAKGAWHKIFGNR